MQLLTPTNRDLIAANLFTEALKRGELWVPPDITGCADVLLSAIHSIAVSRHLPMTVHVATGNGDKECWRVAQAIENFPYDTQASISDAAFSAGLIIALACYHRVTEPDALFSYHGSPRKDGREDDREKAAWFAARTTLPEAEWAEMAESGEEVRFGAEQALEWGVVHEID